MLRIKEILTQKGMTNKDLEQKLGLSKQYVSNLINEKQSASLSRLAEIADALGVGVGELFEDRKHCELTNGNPEFFAMIHFRGQDYHAESISELETLIDSWKTLLFEK